MSNEKKNNRSAQALFSTFFGDTAKNDNQQVNELKVDNEITENSTFSVSSDKSLIKKTDRDDNETHKIETNNIQINNTNTEKNIEDNIMSKTTSNIVKVPYENTSRNEKLMSTRESANMDKSLEKPVVKKVVKSVDIAITGSTYNVNCYSDEIEDLNKAVDYINSFIRNLRKDAPTLEHENLLVLCCLNMYEEMKQEEKHRIQLQELNKKAQALIEKINVDVDSILP